MVSGCTACFVTLRSIHHDEYTAAAKAVTFAKEAFIDLNQPEAYSYLSKDLQNKLTLDKFIDVIAQMHPQKFPQVVVATEFEPMPGQTAMVIWLVGENGSEKFDYRMEMVGTSAGYDVAGLYRVAEKRPSQLRKPLSTKISTDDLR